MSAANTAHQPHKSLIFRLFLLPSSIGQDATLSRWRERFDSARERQCYQILIPRARRLTGETPTIGLIVTAILMIAVVFIAGRQQERPH